MLTPASGASESALAAFQHAFTDALRIAYLVAAGVALAAAVVAALTMRPTPPGASAEGPTASGNVCSSLGRGTRRVCNPRHTSIAKRNFAREAGVIVRIAGEGRWLLPDVAEQDLLLLDNAVTLAVDEFREDEYERLLLGICAFVRQHGELARRHRSRR